MSTSPAIYALSKLDINRTGSFYEIRGVTNLGGPTFTKGEIDVTHMQSTAKEYKPAALADPGTLTFGLQYLPTNDIHSYIVSQSSHTVNSLDTFRITFSDNSKWAFSGSFTNFAVKADNPSQGILTADVSVRLSGQVDFAAS